MKTQYILLATYTFPHEAVFMESMLKNSGIDFKSSTAPALIPNSFYSNQSIVKNIYIQKKDISKALSATRNIQPKQHEINRCNILQFETLNKLTPPRKSEKRFCSACYGVMISGLITALFLIFHTMHIYL